MSTRVMRGIIVSRTSSAELARKRGQPRKPLRRGRTESYLIISHWEGNTLVVEITNYSNKVATDSFFFPAASETLRVVERFTRVSAEKVDYQFTADDPMTWTRPWSATLPMTALQSIADQGQVPVMFEYACHEGNYGMFGILAGHRAQEKAAEAAAKKGSR